MSDSVIFVRPVMGDFQKIGTKKTIDPAGEKVADDKYYRRAIARGELELIEDLELTPKTEKKTNNKAEK